jgi:type III secretion system FlhB-like substrate exporter
MPRFRIEQYELHAYEYEIEAEDEAHAIQMLFDGAAEPTGNPPEYIETAEDYGLPVEQNQELADQLRDLGIHVGEAVIPSIRSIVRVE